MLYIAQGTVAEGVVWYSEEERVYTVHCTLRTVAERSRWYRGSSKFSTCTGRRKVLCSWA